MQDRGYDMTDIKRARQLLSAGGHTCVLCRGGETLTSDSAGIAPMMEFIDAGVDLNGFSAADRIVGRAAALLFALAGVRAVHARVMSRGAADVLKAHGIARSCDALTDRIINRAGTDICPMERAVEGIDDPRAAHAAIAAALERLRAESAGRAAAVRYDRTLKSARSYAAQGALEDWVHAYLLSDGRNEEFSRGLKLCRREYFGPLALPRKLLARCCGPEPGMRFKVDVRGFEARVSGLMSAIASGADMPPLIVNYAGGEFTVNDGNHRLEAYARLNVDSCAAIVWVTGQRDADEFEALRQRGFGGD